VDLWSALRGGFVEQFGLQRTLRAVADTIRSMHREGVYHRDLNLKNILVRQEADRVASYLIDFDRAALFIGQLPAELASRNLDRLLRSACKLDPERRYFSVSAWDEFFDFYHGSSRA
jgi:serine/threonine protein kinase